MRSIGTQILALAFLVASVAAGTVAGIDYRRLVGQIEIQRQEKLATVRHGVQTALDMRARESLLLASYFAEMPAFQDLVARRDRDGVIQLLQRPFEVNRDRLGISQMQVHTETVQSFVRVNQIGKWGDDLSAIRPMLVEVNKDKQPRRGIEDGVSGTAIRGVAPIIDGSGRHVGSIEAGTFLDSAFLKQITPPNTRLEIHFPNQNGFTRTAASHEQDLAFLDEPTLRAALAGQGGVQETSRDGTPYVVVAEPLRDYAGRTIAILEIILDDRGARQAMRDALVESALLSGGMLAAAMLLAIIVGRRIVGPINALTATMTQLAEGRTELVVAGQNRRDEVGTMAKAVEVFRINRIEMDALQATERQELARRQQRTARRDEIIAAFQQSMQVIAGDLLRAADTMRSRSTRLGSVADSTTQQAAAVATATDQTSRNIEAVAAATEELTSSIRDIARQAGDSSRIARDAVAEAERTNGSVASLAEAATRIGEVVNLISSIAAQTNLLALNATIEAARAGDAGKGFAVVASEVKNLANQTARATEEISGQITELQSVAGVAADAIDGIGETIRRIDAIVASIAVAVEQQDANTQDIARNALQAGAGARDVSQNAELTRQNAASAAEMAADGRQGVGQLVDQAEAVRHHVNAFTHQMRQA